MTYTKVVLDNFYNISLEDRITLINRLINLHEINKSDFDYNYYNSLKSMLDTYKKIYSVSRFKDFYNNLNDKEKKEFQTQVYLTSESVLNWRWFDVPNTFDIIKEYTFSDEITDKSYNIDFDMLDSELENSDEYSENLISGAEIIINEFVKRYYNYAFNNYSKDRYSNEEINYIFETYTKPFIIELNSNVNDCISFIKDNINESTRLKFNLIDDDKLIYALFKLIDINKDYLSYMVQKRQELRNLKNQKYKERRSKPRTKVKKIINKRAPRTNSYHN